MILTIDLKDGLLLTPGRKILSFISPTILAFKTVRVVLTICPTTLTGPSSKIMCKSTKFVCFEISIDKLTKTLLSTISLISPNISSPSTLLYKLLYHSFLIETKYYLVAVVLTFDSK